MAAIMPKKKEKWHHKWHISCITDIGFGKTAGKKPTQMADLP